MLRTGRASSKLRAERIDDAARPRLAARQCCQSSLNVGSSGRLCLTTSGWRTDSATLAPLRILMPSVNAEEDRYGDAR